MPREDRADKFYIVAGASVLDPHRLIAKDDETFGVFDRFGDVLPLGKGEQGLYHEGTRHLSRYELRIMGKRPLFLSSNVDRSNIFITADLTNPDIYQRGRCLMKRDSIHIMRSRLLWAGQMLEQIRLKNFAMEATQFDLELLVASDFADIFEVRGIKRRQKGKALKSHLRGSEFRMSYEGLDGVRRTTIFSFSKTPRKKGKSLFFPVRLAAGGMEKIFISASCTGGVAKPSPIGFGEAAKKAQKKLRGAEKNLTKIHTSNEQFNESIKRATSDIHMMITETDYGPYPYGGIPWYSTAFGRDGIITALECLWIKPDIARGVLEYLAARQARDFNRARVAEPGKILHETRKGEMAALGKIPFGLYYGSVDSTPLFVMLAGAYWRRTGDTAFIKRLWESIELAILWMKKHGDIDGDGFLEYTPHKAGLANQGWKDSLDSVFHRDGSFPTGPIALCEVQGYCYAAKTSGALLAGLVGKNPLADSLSKEAEALRKNFDAVFWDGSLGSYVLALDGRKEPCRVLASNAGHALYTGIAYPEKARILAGTLTSEPMFSGWGVRTAAATETRYNPISYHNGSVWPHDNALIAAGLASYGMREEFAKIFSGLFEASLFMEFQRLPELFCGFHKREGQPPTLYPVACTPQTWASGSLILMLQASLGVDFEPANQRIIFRKPTLPEFLDYVHVENLALSPKKTVELRIRRHGATVTVEVVKKPPEVSITVYK